MTYKGVTDRWAGLMMILGFGCSDPTPSGMPAQTPLPSSQLAAPHDVIAAPHGPAWGEPVPDAKTDLLVMRSLSLIATRQPNAIATLGSPVSIGPGLWAALLELDKDSKPPVLAKLGTASKAAFPVGDKQVTLEMRTFLDPKSRERLVAAKAFVTLANLFASGKPRAASSAERRFLYALVPFEFAATPVTIVELTNGPTLIAVVTEGLVLWLDAPSQYGPNFALRK